MELEALSSLLDALPCGAMLVNGSAYIAHINPRFCEMMQRDSGELTGRSLLELYPSDAGHASVQDAFVHVEDSREQEFYLPRSDGTQLPVIVSSRRLQGEPPMGDHRIVTVVDISHQKLVESAL